MCWILELAGVDSGDIILNYMAVKGSAAGGREVPVTNVQSRAAWDTIRNVEHSGYVPRQRGAGLTARGKTRNDERKTRNAECGAMSEDSRLAAFRVGGFVVDAAGFGP
jgi:hypothetical protein